MHPTGFDFDLCSGCSCSTEAVRRSGGCPLEHEAHAAPALPIDFAAAPSEPMPLDTPQRDLQELDDQSVPLTQRERVNLLLPALLVFSLLIAVASCVSRWAK